MAWIWIHLLIGDDPEGYIALFISPVKLISISVDLFHDSSIALLCINFLKCLSEGICFTEGGTKESSQVFIPGTTSRA